MNHRHVLVSLGLAIGGGFVLGPPVQAMQPVDSTPCSHRLISAHEGYRLNADGDTVASQRAAFSVGSNLADTDLWVTTDGYIVEMHDNDVSHSTNGTGLITNKTLAQVRQLRTTRYHEPIPQMVQSLAIPAAHARGRYLQMETKWSFNEKGALQDLNKRIVAAGMVQHVVIYSAYLSQLQKLESIDPHLTTWYKAGSPTSDRRPHRPEWGDAHGNRPHTVARDEIPECGLHGGPRPHRPGDVRELETLRPHRRTGVDDRPAAPSDTRMSRPLRMPER